MKETLVFEIADPAQVAIPVRLHQHDNGTFSVVYGGEARRGLTYGHAAEEFGLCLMLSLYSLGRITR